MNKAYRYRMYPNKEQEVYFSKCFGCTRFIYNKMLEDKIKYYKSNKKMLHNTPAQYKSEFPFLKEPDSLALANAGLQVEASYKNFLNKTHGFPKFKSKKGNKDSYTTNNQNGTIQVENNFIKLPKIGKVKIKEHRIIPEGYKIKSVTIRKYASGKYYVSVLVEYENQVFEITPKKYIGLDYSMHELYVDSNGLLADYPKYYRKSELKLKKEQRKLSHMKVGSNNYRKQKLVIARICETITNQRKDYLHKKSRELVNTYDCICIEDLNMMSMSQMLKFGKSVHDNGWGIFTNYLKYKLEEIGKKLVKVDKFFASSQVCNVCGYKNTEVKDLSIREWVCSSCGTYHDRDKNAAINIMLEGKRILAI